MRNIQDNKDRDYYQNLCYRLNEDIKKLHAKMQAITDSQEKDERVLQLKEKCRDLQNKINSQHMTIYSLKKSLEDKRLENNQKACEQKAVKNIEKDLEKKKSEIRSLRLKITCLHRKLFNYSNIYDLLEKKDSRVYRQFYKKKRTFEKSLLHVNDACLDFECMFCYFKLFEMHVADLVIDKLYVYHLVDMDDTLGSMIFADSKRFTNDIIYKQIPQVTLKLQQLKEAVSQFVKQEAVKIARILLQREDENTKARAERLILTLAEAS